MNKRTTYIPGQLIESALQTYQVVKYTGVNDNGYETYRAICTNTLVHGSKISNIVEITLVPSPMVTGIIY